MQVEVFVSYASEDRPFVEQIVKKLKSGGLRVWWDRQIPVGAEAFPKVIGKAIRSAQCFLAVWSPGSRKEDSYVQDEAHRAKELKIKIVHLSLDNKKPEFPFNRAQCEMTEAGEESLSEDVLKSLFKNIKAIIGLRGPNEHLLKNRTEGDGWGCDDLAVETPVPGMDVLLSFRPCGPSGVFLLMRLDTTDGWVKSDIPTAAERHEPYAHEHESSYKKDGVEYFKVSNDVYFIMDPLRPYGIQVGGLRSMRPSGKPGIIETNVSADEMRYVQTKLKWVCMTLAEILSTAGSLEYLWDRVGDNEKEWGEDAKQSIDKIRKLIARNPNAPLRMQREMCLFCEDTFRKRRQLSSGDQESEYGAYVIANDFPFGPAFHYLAITNEPVHSWESMSYGHARGLNLILYEFLSDEENRRGAAGISFGFNSTIRHLILGAQTHSSAGASIPHVHKQAWGMAQGTANLAERLIEVSQAYWNHNVDYQWQYFKALDESGYVIWKNEYVALYVPYGQCSKHELQAVVLRPTGCLTDLTAEEVKSLSVAEYITLRIFRKLGINSFNHVVLSKLYKDNRAPSFRLVEAFITREVDLAVSELSMLFVVDQHPWDSRKEIVEQWEPIKDEVREEVEKEDPDLFDWRPTEEASG